MRALLSTYRVQLNDGFTLDDARRRLGYLEALGVSHLYCSPILAARSGSTHGYDVTDPTQVNPALGGMPAFEALATEAHERNIGILLDIVPNHMGICADNPFWDDVLMFGAKSTYADWFDISWRATPRDARGKLLLPVLGDTLENVLSRGEITLSRVGNAVRVKYFSHSFPVNPATVPAEARDLDAFTRGAEGRDHLRRLLARQHYRLTHWRASHRDLNYRRFFDVNDLICLKIEREDVFHATHRTVLDMIERGLVDALRVDHIDGLLEPRRYLRRLRDAVDARAHGRAIPILVEKILAPGERLPQDWDADGTTGYELLTALDDLCIDREGLAAIERDYPKQGRTFADIVLASKRRVLRTTLNSDIRRLAPMLAALATDAEWPAASIASCAGALVEFIAHLPVYRTYIDHDSPSPSAADRRVLEMTVAQISKRPLDAHALEALRRTLLDDWSALPSALGKKRLAFVLRLQQLCGPAAAKGVEDTALYAFAPLASRSEVGADPGADVAGARERLHALFASRAVRWPLALSPVTTHDTKRTADARSRIDALSVRAVEWRRAQRHWTRHHRALQQLVRGKLVPSRRVQDFIYQSAIAIWPLDEAGGASIEPRLKAYMLKAAREAKLDTTWTDPNVEYERAIDSFLERVLDERNEPFLGELSGLVVALDRIARATMVARTVIQHLGSGVPDVYQGDELWYTALVDPDNRRPVDYQTRENALERISTLPAPAHAVSISDSKLAVIRALLQLRREFPALANARYEPLAVEGKFADRIFAFRRTTGSEGIVVMAGCHAAGTEGGWEDTRVVLPEKTGRVRCVLHGTVNAGFDGEIFASTVFHTLPSAVLVSVARP